MESRTALRGIICDLGGVVVRIDPTRVVARLAALSGLSPEEVASRYPDARYEAFERDECTEVDHCSHLRQRLCLDADDDEVSAAFNDLFLGVDREVLAVLQDLRERDLRVIALSNTNRTHHAVWSTMFASELAVFDQVHCSFELGARKPEPRAYSAVLETHGLAAGEVLFVDDTPSNVEAARASGLDGVLFSDAGDLRRAIADRRWLARGDGAMRITPHVSRVEGGSTS